MNFIGIDITLLVIFLIFSGIFLYSKRENLKKEGALFLYKTQIGVKLIDYIGGKYKKTLKFLSYLSIVVGYFLMAGILYLMVNTTYQYLTTNISSLIKAPPLAPLIPYFPQLFGLENFFPPFYFIYFVLALIIVATVHEFSHGIFAKRYGIKIKSTGFAFLKYFPALFGAFVEQDEKQMNKVKNFEQKSILSAGTFANVLTAVFFYIILFIFFTSAFTASGVTFNEYPYGVVNVSEIENVNDVLVENSNYNSLLNLMSSGGLNNISTSKGNYVIDKDTFELQKDNKGLVALYYDAPAINRGIGNTILEIDGVVMDSKGKLEKEILNHNPGDKIKLKVLDDEKIMNYEITLGESPDDPEKPWLGIGFYEESSGFVQKLLGAFPNYKKPNIYYETDNEFNVFIKDLLWWIFIINIFVALFNMLPLGILDGGRFFYLTILGITKKEKIAKKSSSTMNWLIILIFVILMVRWLIGIVF